MLLTITYQADPAKGERASDLGFLLFKHPANPKTVSLNHGKAHVFYPEVGEERCTAALLLDIDPIDLARGKAGTKGGGLFDYVNDRPYVSSSFMSTAISRVFGTAMTGRCDANPALALQKLDLCANVVSLPCGGDLRMPARVFEPLGYSVSCDTTVLDEEYPAWGSGKYVNLTLRGKVRLQDLLHHLYVLIPVFDRKKHYWIGPEEVDKLLRHGEGWLEAHPEKEFITRRFMGGRQSLTRLAMDGLQLDRMDDGQTGGAVSELFGNTEAPCDFTQEAGARKTQELGVQGGFMDAPSEEDAHPKQAPLNTQRLHTVIQVLKDIGAGSVIDMGCGEGRLLYLLMKDRAFSKIAGMDVSWQALEKAAQRLKLDRLPEAQRGRIALFQSSLTYKDERFSGYDAASVVEVIEHLDENRLTAFAQILFGEARPSAIVLTTPNKEYNQNYAALVEGAMRHSDHRFEWTRQEFALWAETVAKQYGYTVELRPIGDEDENYGAPTQMGVFIRCE